ncbi:MAG: hypothetical protein AAGK04_13795, partial [Planctomycetota bacterium]
MIATLFGAEAPLYDAPTLAQGLVLVSWWKPVLLLLPLGFWAYVVSVVLDKQAARFHLGRDNWNAVHMAVGTLAFLGVLLIPGEFGFFIALPTLCVILALDVIVFALLTNKDERVPDRHRLKLDLAALKPDADAKAKKKASALQKTAELVIKRPDKSTLSVPEKDAPEYELRVAAEELVLSAKRTRGSQVDLAPDGREHYVSSFLVDGVRQKGRTMSRGEAEQLIAFWKDAAGLDPEDRRRKLTGDLSLVQFDQSSAT